MANYDITEVVQQEDWSNNHGAYASFLMRLQGHDGQVQINCKKKPDGSHFTPKQGESISGEIELQANGVPKFKREYSGGSSGGYSGGSRKKDGPSEEYWAGKDKRISRQHSQEMALRYAAIKGKTDVTFDDIKKLADAFDNDLPELPSA